MTRRLKLMSAGAAALFMALASTGTAQAHGDEVHAPPPAYGGYGYNQHDRVHERLGRQHDRTHDRLGAQHEAYHYFNGNRNDLDHELFHRQQERQHNRAHRQLNRQHDGYHFRRSGYGRFGYGGYGALRGGWGY